MKYSSLNAHIKAVKAYAELSHAKRLKVGALLIRDDRIVSIGYNGMPSGGSNECEDIEGDVMVTKPGVCHAELNVVAFAARNGIKTDGTDLLITHSPCYECCKLIIQSGIKDVYYLEEYRDPSGISFLQEHNISVHQVAEV